MPTFEVTRDQYNYEQPFPVQTVYEMQRVRPTHPQLVAQSLPAGGATLPTVAETATSPTGASASGGGVPAADTLLLPHDAALLIRSLEERLGHSLQRITVLEEDLDTYRLRAETATTRQLTAEKMITELTARNEELQKQLGAVRNECQGTVLSATKANEAAVAHAVEQCTAHWRGVEASLQATLAAARAEGAKNLTEKNQLELLVKELKEQLLQNATSLQTSTSTIRELATELLGAKQQSTFISNGYKQLEAQLKQANSLNHSQTAEIATLKSTVASLSNERDLRAKFEGECNALRAEYARLQPAEAERQRLSALSAKLERDMADKDRELQALKTQIDTVRNQAATAYEHTNRFRLGGGAVDPMSASLLGAAAGGHHHDDHLAVLRREIEDEERRYIDESKRWRQKDASHR